ncbi:MAG: hypothetical protein ACRDRT_17705 [Pseudonocardiaceae bacterium]
MPTCREHGRSRRRRLFRGVPADVSLVMEACITPTTRRLPPPTQQLKPDPCGSDQQHERKRAR